MSEFASYQAIHEKHFKQLQSVWYETDSDDGPLQGLKKYFSQYLISSGLIAIVLFLMTLGLAVGHGSGATPLMLLLQMLKTDLLVQLYQTALPWLVFIYNVAFCLLAPLLGLVAYKLSLSVIRHAFTAIQWLSELARYAVSTLQTAWLRQSLMYLGAVLYYPLTYLAKFLDTLCEKCDWAPHALTPLLKEYWDDPEESSLNSVIQNIQKKLQENWQHYFNAVLMSSVCLFVVSVVLGCLNHSVLVWILGELHATPLLNALLELHPLALYAIDLVFACSLSFVVIPSLGLCFNFVSSAMLLGTSLNKEVDDLEEGASAGQIVKHILSRTLWFPLSAVKHACKTVQLIAQACDSVLELIGAMGTLIVVFCSELFAEPGQPAKKPDVPVREKPSTKPVKPTTPAELAVTTDLSEDATIRAKIKHAKSVLTVLPLLKKNFNADHDILKQNVRVQLFNKFKENSIYQALGVRLFYVLHKMHWQAESKSLFKPLLKPRMKTKPEAHTSAKTTLQLLSLAEDDFSTSEKMKTTWAKLAETWQSQTDAICAEQKEQTEQAVVQDWLQTTIVAKPQLFADILQKFINKLAAKQIEQGYAFSYQKLNQLVKDIAVVLD